MVSYLYNYEVVKLVKIKLSPILGLRTIGDVNGITWIKLKVVLVILCMMYYEFKYVRLILPSAER